MFKGTTMKTKPNCVNFKEKVTCFDDLEDVQNAYDLYEWSGESFFTLYF